MLVSENTDSPGVVKTLTDDYSRKILFSISSKSLSVEEISIAEHIPVSTCYRRVHNLKTIGIIRQVETFFTEDGKKFFRYRSILRNATINFNSGRLEVKVILDEANEDPILPAITSTEKLKPVYEDLLVAV
jgi:predicted transcriptional regulator